MVASFISPYLCIIKIIIKRFFNTLIKIDLIELTIYLHPGHYFIFSDLIILLNSNSSGDFYLFIYKNYSQVIPSCDSGHPSKFIFLSHIC